MEACRRKQMCLSERSAELSANDLTTHAAFAFKIRAQMSTLYKTRAVILHRLGMQATHNEQMTCPRKV